MAESLEVAQMFIAKGHKVRKVLSYAQVSHSTWYNQFHRNADDRRSTNRGRPVPGFSFAVDGSKVPDEHLKFVLRSYRSKDEFLNAGGYHKLSHYLKRDYNFIVNHKKVYRLCKENDLLLPKKKKKNKGGKRYRSKARTITSSNQLWELDLKYGYIHGENRFFFILVILDVFDRYVVNYFIGLRCTGTDLALTLKTAVKYHKVDEGQLVVRSDNGTQMTSKAMYDYVHDLDEGDLIHEFIPPATPNMNAHIEAFNSILEIEFLSTRYFLTYGQAYEETVKFMSLYNTDRIHGSLKMATPAEVRKIYLEGGDFGLKEVKV